MTAQTTKHVIAVGVDASGASVAALRYAAEAARVWGWDLHIISGYDVPSLFPDLVGRFEAAALAAAAVVDRALDQVDVDNEVSVTRTVENRPAAVLLRAARSRVQVVVLGQHHLDLLDGLPGGRLSSSVSRRSSCPVVVVPDHWDLPTPTDLPVVVAVDGTDDAHLALSHAADEARIRETSVRVLHVIPPEGESSFPSEERASIGELTAGTEQDNPDTLFMVEIVTGDVKRMIVDASRQASLLVVGRPHRPGWGSWRLSVARGVLDIARCPVMLVPFAPR